MDGRNRTWFCRKHDHGIEFENNLVSHLENDLDYLAIGYHFKSENVHWHYILHFKNKKSKKQMIKLMGNGDHEIMRGNIEQGLTYLSKDGICTEWGKKPRPGERTDLAKARDMMMEKGKIKEVVKLMPSIQALRFAECSAKYLEPQRDRNIKPKIIWFYGPPGKGKSLICHCIAEFLEEDYHTQMIEKWFDGYDANEVVIFEEFRMSLWDFRNILCLFDRYPARVQTKGGTRQWVANIILVNSQENPDEVWEPKENIEQLKRRITAKIHIFF